MKLNKKTAQIIIDLEQIIGSSCYNPHSTDGYTGDVGRSIRYPVWADAGSKTEQDFRKFRYKVADVLPDKTLSMYYKFGANEMSIGLALHRALEYLEKRYNIDFNELEKGCK